MYRSFLVQQKISENQRIFLKITECSRKDKSFKPITESYQTIMELWRLQQVFTESNGISRRLCLKNMLFRGRAYNFTGEYGILTGSYGILRESTGLLREGTVFHGREWYFTGEPGISRERTGYERYFTGENGISRERTGFHGRERDFTG